MLSVAARRGDDHSHLPAHGCESVPGQIAAYDDGVGADGLEAVRIVEGATGAGLAQKIQDGYYFIAEQYQPGDYLYLCGFSRGAYTVRSLGGLLTHCGLPTTGPITGTLVTEAYDVYRGHLADTTAQFRRQYAVMDVLIEVIAVWDTVGALGIPLKLFDRLDHYLFRFEDTALHPNIRFGYHAVAIDEQRESFVPTLWDPREGIEQVWFAGVHADVGGGYAEADLSNITLAWMLEKLRLHGVLFRAGTFTTQGAATVQGDPSGLMHNSYKPPFVTLLGPSPRHIPSSAALHESVQIRLANTTLGYHPTNLPTDPRKYVK
jgi:uncharacterized protein (DUF2235 family)